MENKTMNSNKFGIKTSTSFGVSLEENVSALAKAGFEASFFPWQDGEDYSEYLRLYDKYAIMLNSIHAPFAGINCMWRDGSEGDDYVKLLCRCVDAAKSFGAPNIVMHPVSGESVPLSSRIGIDRWRRIIDYANLNGIKVCFENVEYSEMLGIVMDEFGNDVGFCYDTGHESTNDPGIRFLKLFGDRLTCTHIHDNYGLSYLVSPIMHSDCHMIPLDASIDFKRVMGDIRSVEYKGVLMLESNRHEMLKTYMDYSIWEFYEKAFSALNEIANY